MTLAYERMKAVEEFLEKNLKWCNNSKEAYNSLFPVVYSCDKESLKVVSDMLYSDSTSMYLITQTGGEKTKTLLITNDHYQSEDSVKVDDHFQDWLRPTEQEKDYFEMIYGVRIPWSEEHPYIRQEYKQ